MKLEKINEIIESYSKEYRSQKLEPFKISLKYHLFPQKDEYGWPETWPHTGSGVYIICDDTDEIIYVGQSKELGLRLSSYFSFGENKSVRIKHNGWHPTSLVTISVPKSSPFERLSLEEFLINKLNPLYNIIGKFVET